MPPPRKVDLLPSEIRDWLHEELKSRGFGGYEQISEALNFRLEEAGKDLRIGKSSLHAYGAEFREYAQLQAQAQDEVRAFLTEMSAGEEIDVTNALFQQLSSIAFKLNMEIASNKSEIDPKGMKDLTTALNNLIRSTELREKIGREERAKLKAEQAAEMARQMGEASASGDQAKRKALEAARDAMGLGQ